KGINSTPENLKKALAGETQEFKNMYPGMIELADREGHKSAARSFRYANEVEKTHAELYQRAIDNLENMEECDYYVCSVCGHTHEKEAPEKCPVCGAKSNAFFKSS
ncbi:MAG: rubrerythrin family protein, partial [Desulfurivibrionaceae bacterium]|nr:rubrerythrin family protein [Desulfurivibrionaceae bacterium]